MATQEAPSLVPIKQAGKIKGRQILNPLGEVRDRSHIFMDTSWILKLLSHNGNL